MTHRIFFLSTNKKFLELIEYLELSKFILYSNVVTFLQLQSMFPPVRMYINCIWRMWNKTKVLDSRNCYKNAFDFPLPVYNENMNDNDF